MPRADGISREELQLAARNHGMPLEALRHELTPIGLHYLLIHYDIPLVDPATWRLEVDGAVLKPLSIGIDELRALPATTLTATLECAGNGRALLEPRPLSQPWLQEAVGNAEWTGVRLDEILTRAEPAAGTIEALFTGLDRGVEGGEEQAYARSLPLDVAREPGVILAHTLNGVPLPVQHGFPLRLVVPGWYGMASVKWLDRITLLTEPFTGYQQARGYRWRVSDDDPGVPLSRVLPRALMVPPGIPEFMTRTRFAPAGYHLIEGRAWSGWGAVTGVDFSDDDGESWAAADLAPGAGSGWRHWTVGWDATAGDHVLCCRARDASGREQPAGPQWNAGGYANNAVQRVPVTVG